MGRKRGWPGQGRAGQGRAGQGRCLSIFVICDTLYKPNTRCFTVFSRYSIGLPSYGLHKNDRRNLAKICNSKKCAKIHTAENRFLKEHFYKSFVKISAMAWQ